MENEVFPREDALGGGRVGRQRLEWKVPSL